MLLQQIRVFFLTGFLIFCGQANAQTLSGQILCKERSEKIILFTFRGTHLIPVDSISPADNRFSFRISQHPEGYYRLRSGNFSTDIILSRGESPEFTFHDCRGDSISVSGSLENRLLNELKTIRRNSSDSVFYAVADSLFSRHPETFFSRTSRPYLRARFSRMSEQEFLDNIPFAYETVIRSTVMPGLFMQYFKDYVQYDEPGFRFAIDTLISLSSVHPETKEFTIEFLLELFHKAGPEVIFEYIAENYYLGESCNGNITANEHASRYLTMRPGSIAPDTTIFPLSGEPFSLSGFYLKQPVTLIYFWSSDCPHCMNEHAKIRKLKEVFGEKLGIVGISIDGDIETCNNTVEAEKMNWPTACEILGWDSPLVRKFLVNKTPSMVLVDQYGKLLSRNVMPSELPARLQRLLAN